MHGWLKDAIDRDEEYLRCITNVLIEGFLRDNVKVVEEFVNNGVAKVGMDNKDLLGSISNFFDKGS